MSEILSREKELLNINQKLNQMTTDAIVQHTQHTQLKTLNGGAAAPAQMGGNEPKFGTFTKQKGTSTLLKKNAPGDVFHDLGAMRLFNNHKERADATFTRNTYNSRNSNHKHNNNNNNTSNKSHTNSKHTAPGRLNCGKPRSPDTLLNTSLIAAAKCCMRKLENITNNNNNNNNNNDDGSNNNTSYDSTTYRVASAGNSKHSSSNGSGNNNNNSNDDNNNNNSNNKNKTATYIKYRNPNFQASPSLTQLPLSEQATCESPTELHPIRRPRTVTCVINGIARKLSTENYIKYLKSQIGLYEEEQAHLKEEMSKQKELLESTYECHRHIEQQRDQAWNSKSQLMDKLHNAEAQLEETNRRHKEQQLEMSRQQKEFEVIKRELRVSKQANVNLENRLARAHEDVEAARTTITAMRGDEREARANSRRELDEKDKHIKSLKQQRVELISAYKKQLFLIDNLRRQNACMEQSAVIRFTEKEFNKVFEWNAQTDAAKP